MLAHVETHVLARVETHVLARVEAHVLARVETHVLARVATHVLAHVETHVLACVVTHVHDYYLKTCVPNLQCTKIETVEQFSLAHSSLIRELAGDILNGELRLSQICCKILGTLSHYGTISNYKKKSGCFHKKQRAYSTHVFTQVKFGNL